MKRRHRKTVLDINGELDSPRRRWQNKYQQIVVDHPEQNGTPENPLANLLGQYNSDSEADEEHRPANKLNDQVNDFLKEIQQIAPENVEKQESSETLPPPLWQECIDEATGYPYYWHTETNEVTWEMPAELHCYLEKTQQESATPSSHIAQWSNSCYSQTETNIPDGMIPKEVVVRNRNRQAGIKQVKKERSPKPAENKPPGFKDDSFDDGKIEMITSFGDEESESEESDSEIQSLKVPKKCSVVKSSEQKRESNFIRKPENESIGPQLPPVMFGPKNSSLSKESKMADFETNTNSKSSFTDKLTLLSGHAVKNESNEDDILKRLKNQAKLLQTMGSNCTKSSSETLLRLGSEEGVEKKKGSKLSLVPGYEDDSEGEDDSLKKSKPLFPIQEYGDTSATPISVTTSMSEKPKGEKIVKMVETEAGCIRIFDYRGVESENTEMDREEKFETEDGNRIEDDDNQESDVSKANKFLESLEAPTKAFQRKKRLTFDVIPNKNKPQESQEKPIAKDEKSGIQSSVASIETEHEKDEDSSENDSATTISKSPLSPNKPSTNESQMANADKEVKPSAMTESERNEFRISTDMIMEKLRFLSEGSPMVSGVQIMAIQLQTLLIAWESGDLEDNYLRTWLSSTSCELGRLEQTAAPAGWDCQWDRTHKRYYYRNLTTGEAQWTYPQADIAGGTEEMELCTTPPPPEQEQDAIIEMRTQTPSEASGATKKSVDETDDVQESATPEVPPPPQISSPSPPPPPKICADDFKQGKKRNSDGQDTEKKEQKESETVNPPLPTSPKAVQPPPPPMEVEKNLNSEPLPPGVDPPEMAYSLTSNAIDAGVLYTHQTNPIYAATLGSAGMPMLAHHHTALMHSQVMHYPAYHHHHLHNSILLQQQALVAARLNGQEAVQAMMMSEYARLYDNNQVITKPPVKTARESLGSAINSFYSDLASIENKAETELKEYAESVPSPVQISHPPELEMPAAVDATKEKKKKKIKAGIGKKQKKMSSMVAKWQKAYEKNFKDGR